MADATRDRAPRPLPPLTPRSKLALQGSVAARTASERQEEHPPYRVLLLAAVLGGASIALIAALLTGLHGSYELAWVYIGGAWLSRSQITRSWRHRRYGRASPAASLFALLATTAGLLAATTHAVPEHRPVVVIYAGLFIAFLGGDVLDWDWRRRRTRDTANVHPAPRT